MGNTKDYSTDAESLPRLRTQPPTHRVQRLKGVELRMTTGMGASWLKTLYDVLTALTGPSLSRILTGSPWSPLSLTA